MAADQHQEFDPTRFEVRRWGRNYRVVDPMGVTILRLRHGEAMKWAARLGQKQIKDEPETDA